MNIIHKKRFLINFLLLFLFIFPDLVLVLHNHGDEKISECENFCLSNCVKDEGLVLKQQKKFCSICEFSKYNFERTKLTTDLTVTYFELIPFFIYNSLQLQNYLLNLNLLRSPPLSTTEV